MNERTKNERTKKERRKEKEKIKSCLSEHG